MLPAGSLRPVKPPPLLLRVCLAQRPTFRSMRWELLHEHVLQELKTLPPLAAKRRTSCVGQQTAAQPENTRFNFPRDHRPPSQRDPKTVKYQRRPFSWLNKEHHVVYSAHTHVRTHTHVCTLLYNKVLVPSTCIVLLLPW